MLPTDSLYMISRREGSGIAVDCFCNRYKLEWISPNYRYDLFQWYFSWYSFSRLGRLLYKLTYEKI